MSDNQSYASELATELAAQVWCEEETKSITMDTRLAERFARVLAAWIETGIQHHQNKLYYQSLLDQCGKAIGKESFICDDGSVSEDVLRAKIPSLVEALVKERSEA